MTNPALNLGVAWPGGGQFDVAYIPACIAAALLTLVFLLLLKRTADEHARLLEEQEREERAAARDEEREGGAVVGLVLLLALPVVARAQEPQPSPSPAASITVGPIVEAYVSWNANRPRNGLTAFRGFDARHNTFALSNAVVDTRWNAGPVSGRLALQTGDTPDIYYGAEASSDLRHVLEATIAWKTPVGRGLTFDGGLFLSPIGPEGMLVKDNWTWSRSTLFFALPFYHAGVRATYAMSERWNVTGAIYNGWNNVTDTNDRKSVSVQALHTRPDKVTASFLYFGGVERPRSAPEGQPWRHLFDSHIIVTVSPTLSIQAHADAGFENTTFGRSSWLGAAVAARIKATSWLSVAGRADILSEAIPTSPSGSAATLFFPTSRVRSLTATLDARPADRLSARLEWRHDRAADAIYFKGTASAPSSKSQSTLTLGLTAWF